MLPIPRCFTIVSFSFLQYLGSRKQHARSEWPEEAEVSAIGCHNHLVSVLSAGTVAFVPDTKVTTKMAVGEPRVILLANPFPVLARDFSPMTDIIAKSPEYCRQKVTINASLFRFCLHFELVLSLTVTYVPHTESVKCGGTGKLSVRFCVSSLWVV